MAAAKPRRVAPLPDGKAKPFDPRPMLEAAEAAYPAFPFFGLDGKLYELPHANMLPGGIAMRMQAAGKDDQMAVIEEILTAEAPDAWAAVNAMPGPLMLAVIEKWYEALGIEEDDDEESGEESDPGKAA